MGDTFCALTDVAYCPNGHPLVDLTLNCWQGRIHIRVCDKCRNEIDRDASRMGCDKCGYDLCRTCSHQRRALKRNSTSFSLHTVEVQWELCEMVLRALFSSGYDLKAVFTLADSSKDGRVERTEFVNSTSRALRKSRRAVEEFYNALCCYMSEVKQQDCEALGLSVSDLIDSVTVWGDHFKDDGAS